MKKKIVAYIKNNASGEIRIDEYDVDEQYAENQVFWWQEGNAACDCNRLLFWHRVEDPDYEVVAPCGHEMFSVSHITIDGVRREIDHAPETGAKS